MPRDRLSLAIEVRGEVHGIRPPRFSRDEVHLGATVIGHDVLGGEVVVDIDAELALAGVLGEVSHVAVGGQHLVVATEGNPVWQRIGVLVPSTDASGVERLSLWMSFQTRTAIGRELKSTLGLPE